MTTELHTLKYNKMEKKELINLALKEVAIKYSESPATTNAGRWLRLIVKYLPTDLIIKAFAHKLSR
jgi:hypothetical protein